jgi:hypothetical protein
MIEYLRDLISKSKPGEKYGKLEPKVNYFMPSSLFPKQCLDADNRVTGSYVLQFADDFMYTDPVSLNIVHVLCLVVTSSN